jgi:O-antigen ligase
MVVVYLSSLILYLMFLGAVADNSIRILLTMIVIFVSINYFLKSGIRLVLRYCKIEYIIAVTLFLVISIFRTNNDEVTTFFVIFRIILPVTTLLFISSYSTYYIIKKRIKVYQLIEFGVVYPLSTIMIVNLILYFFGLEGGTIDIGRSLMLGNFGFDVERVNFYISGGINSYGVLIGSVAMISSANLLNGKNNIKNIVLFAFAIFTLLLTDTRAVVFLLVLYNILQFTLGLNSIQKIATYAAPALSIIGPFIFVLLLPFLSGTEFADLISRSSTDLETGNSRLLMWASSIVQYSSFQGFEHVFGYGEYGHYGSGASLAWGHMFNSFGNNALLTHPHNTYLSVLMDTGFIGVLSYLIFQLKSIRSAYSLRENDIKSSTIIISILFYFYLIGITETIWGLYYPGIYLTIFGCVVPLAIAKSYIE